MEAHKRHEIATAEASKHEPRALNKPFGYEWGPHYWGKWQTITYALKRLGLKPGATVLDVGMGTGWTTLFLAELGFEPTGIDIAPASVEVGTTRAERWDSHARFQAADMDSFDLGQHFDGALVFDALHHSTRQREAVARIAAHLKPGGVVLFGEPSWLHSISPHARRESRKLGWVERGVRARSLKADCRAAGMGDFRRFYEGTSPHVGRARDFAYQAARLAGARVSAAPQMHIWLAARPL